MRKRGQMEVLGLAIVVILISLGFLFILRFNLTKEPPTQQKEYIQAEISSNFLNTLLQTTAIDCFDLSFTEIFQDCGKGPTFECENGQETCKYIQDQVDQIFDETLNTWRIDYRFSAFVNPGNLLVESESDDGCPGSFKSKTFPLPLSTSTMFLKLDVC